ncbi:MAG TPA: MFS transporter [Candidatus Limnocylindria bacterium]|nr:MFS transporter [Candidatus Limnocylindria bacterium]
MTPATGSRTAGVLPVLLDTEPKPRISWRGMLVLSAFWFAIAYLMQALGSFVIPRLIEGFLRSGSIHPVTLHLAFLSLSIDKNTYVAILDTFGALFAVVWQPAIGGLSDRSRFALGRRRPYIVIGVVGDIVFLTLMAFVTSYWSLLVVYAFFQLASNTVQGPYQGMLPDQVPEDQRSEASGYYGGIQLLGSIVGFVVIGAVLSHALQLAIFSTVAVIAICGAIVVLRVPDLRVTRASDKPLGKTLLLSFAIDVRRYRDFAWLMVSRLFFLMGPVGIVTYALFFLQDTFHLTEDQASVYTAALLASVTILAALASFLGGFAAARLGKKRLIAAACLVGALGAGLEIAAPSIWLVLAFGAIIGISLGAFLSVDWAFMTDLIPKVEAGRFMGLSNIATASAGVFARPILGPIIDAFNNHRTSAAGYRVMFGVVVLFYLIAFVALQPVREIKIE